MRLKKGCEIGGHKVSTDRIVTRELAEVLSRTATGTELGNACDVEFVKTVFRLHPDYKAFEGGEVLGIRVERAVNSCGSRVKGFRLIGRNGTTAFMSKDGISGLESHIDELIYHAVRAFGYDCTMTRAQHLLSKFLDREALSVLDLWLEPNGMTFVCADAAQKLSGWRAFCEMASTGRV